jgi:hypothetical protein
MLTALILICMISNSECTEKTAVFVLRVPEEFSTPTSCLMAGQEYVSTTQVAPLDDEKMIVICKKSADVATHKVEE